MRGRRAYVTRQTSWRDKRATDYLLLFVFTHPSISLIFSLYFVRFFSLFIFFTFFTISVSLSTISFFSVLPSWWACSELFCVVTWLSIYFIF